MTEEIDTDAMRRALAADTLGVNDVDAIIDALDAARAEIASLSLSLAHRRDRAERTEAVITQVRAALAALDDPAP